MAADAGNVPQLRAIIISHTVGVEFALHPQHETSCDSEIQMKKDFNYFKSKSRKRLRSLSTVSLEHHKSPHRMDWIPI